MPKWYIEGADKSTGKDRTILVSAATQDDAMNQAGERGILVSTATDTADIREEVPSPAITTKAGTQIPGYQDILTGNGVLRFFAIILQILGVLGLIISAVIAAQSSSATVVVAGVSYATVCFVWATLLKMFGSVAVAVRDIARNSFD